MIEFFLTIIIVYFLWLVVKPLVTRYMRRKIQQKVEDMFRNAYGASFGATGQRGDTRKQPDTPRARRRKIFARDEGEYVEFQEITIEVTAETTVEPGDKAPRHTPAEPRISDAEWEEIV